MIITYQIQQSIKPIELDDVGKFELLAKEVEEYEIRKLLGIEFYFDLIENKTLDKYKKLLEGDTVVINDCTYSHQGLYYIEAYLIYAKYIGQAGINDTYSGFVVHNNEYSTRVSEGTITRLQKDAINIALFEFDLLKKYIYAKKDDYPKFFESNRKDYSEIFKPRIWTVRKY